MAESVAPVSAPRAVRRGPKITVSCRCGAKQYLSYGEQWTCEECGRHWDTNQIPVEQYAAIRSTQLRYRRVPLAISAVALACIVAGVLVGKALGGLIIVAIIATTWSMFFRPIHSRKYRQALAQLPTWTLTPDR
ncbi:MAG TPA: hypothetical protein VFW09_19120 [Solirubrobacteraceae bacterium]|nr:hypothetical protein [Solirubrobacteraceae bacterium]